MSSEGQQALRLRLDQFMPSLRVPKNKVVRLVINIGFIVCWHWITSNIIYIAIFRAIPVFADMWVHNFFDFLYCLYVSIPMALVTRYLWFGRLKPRPRITRPKDDQMSEEFKDKSNKKIFLVSSNTLLMNLLAERKRFGLLIHLAIFA